LRHASQTRNACHYQAHETVDTGVIVAAPIHGADEGDTVTLDPTLAAAEKNLAAVGLAPTSEDPCDLVADKGYHSRDVLKDLDDSPWKTRIAEPRPSKGYLREMGSSQTVLPFKLAASDESLTAHGGLALFDEYLRAMSIRGLIDHELPSPGSAAGYDPSAHILPLILMLAGGGRTLEDLRVLRHDEGLRLLLRLHEMPSSDVTGDWLRRMST